MDDLKILENSRLFAGIRVDEIQPMLSCLQAVERKYPRGAYIFHTGEEVRALALLVRGTAHIQKEDFWGNRSIVGLAGPGEVFAESYALAGEPLSVSVLAASDGAALFLDAHRLADARLTDNLLSLLAKKNLMLTGKMRHMARRTTRDKLLSYLSAQALAAGSSEFDIPMDRQQLADYLAVDRSAMSAALGKLRDEGVLTFRKNHFRLLGEERD